MELDVVGVQAEVDTEVAGEVEEVTGEVEEVAEVEVGEAEEEEEDDAEVRAGVLAIKEPETEGLDKETDLDPVVCSKQL